MRNRQLNLFWLFYDKVWGISLAGLFFQGVLYTGGTLLDGNKMVPEAKFCGIFFHRVLACGTFSVNAINNSTFNIFFLILLTCCLFQTKQYNANDVRYKLKD